MSVTIVTLSKYPEIFEGLEKSLAGEPYRKILVTDGRREVVPVDWEVVEGIQPFLFARNANLGIQAAGRDDVLLTNDDTQFGVQGSLADLEAEALAHPEVGILAPRVKGRVGNPLQDVSCMWPGLEGQTVVRSFRELAFVSVYIKRELVDKIGLLDERFTGYGGEDTDYSRRAVQAGYLLAVTKKCTIQHGFGDLGMSASWVRASENQLAAHQRSQQELDEKWNEIDRLSKITPIKIGRS